MKIKMFDGMIRTLADVRHVPGLGKNLISLEALESNGCKYTAQGGVLKVIKEALVVLKGQRVRFNAATHTSKGMLEYVHTDVWGPLPVKSKEGKEYFVTFIDNFSRKVWVYFMRHKSEVFEKFKELKAQVETSTEKKIKCLRSDNGGEYKSTPFMKLCKNEGIKRHFTIPDMPQQNGVAERVELETRESAENGESSDEAPKVKEMVEVPRTIATGRGRRTPKASERYSFEDMVAYALTISSGDPSSYHEALKSDHKEKWMTAMMEEMESLQKNEAWELVKKPKDWNVIGCK
ncbi:uncharacterized protein LOC120286999 [Eucalyptus grandis]|uniref:uncharacterized protein LOC120286999 n=1 Tax=Eucalyptus grandis TaxID=71139 RepID=UPI00192EE909|nr:uncharacterized protein LOC120286999 [Eucalyptus grandis]